MPNYKQRDKEEINEVIKDLNYIKKRAEKRLFDPDTKIRDILFEIINILQDYCDKLTKEYEKDYAE